MAVVIESSYGKTIGLPGYSSHKFMLTIKTEVSDVGRIGAEAERVYNQLQKAVDEQIVNPGFVPKGPPPGAGAANGNGAGSMNGDGWNCSDKQRELILRIVDENGLDKKEVDALARDRFGVGVRELNKLGASGLIDELLEKYGGSRTERGGRYSGRRRSAAAGGRRRG